MNVEDHISWAEVVASKFLRERNIPIEHEEVVSLGMVGLMKAARNYKEGEAGFRTFAWVKVRGEIKDQVTLRMSGKRYAKVMSLDSIPEWIFPSVNGTEERVINKDLVERILDSVEYNEAYALKRYYLDDCCMAKIGKEMGVTGSRISQILTSGRERARKLWAKQI